MERSNKMSDNLTGFIRYWLAHHEPEITVITVWDDANFFSHFLRVIVDDKIFLRGEGWTDVTADNKIKLTQQSLNYINEKE
jgi:heme-degrading monooxygenase HmoA